MNPEKPTVSLVLGSGGARGLAHIGVIERLIQDDFEIRSIAGSSMGALIGGIYATGKLDVYTRWVTALERIDVIRLLDVSFGGDGLFKGERIIEVLKELIGDANIEDLPIRFTAVATDLEDETEVRFDHGSLFDAIRASIAIPSVFRPHAYQGRQYLDGSLTNPLPITATLNDDTDLTIAVNLSAKPEPRIVVEQGIANNNNKQRAVYHQRIVEFINGLKQRLDIKSTERLGMFDVIVKAMTIMEDTITQVQLATHSPDIVIEIPRNICAFYEFHRAREIIEIGRQKTDEVFNNMESRSVAGK